MTIATDHLISPPIEPLFRLLGYPLAFVFRANRKYYYYNAISSQLYHFPKQYSSYMEFIQDRAIFANPSGFLSHDQIANGLVVQLPVQDGPSSDMLFEEQCKLRTLSEAVAKERIKAGACESPSQEDPDDEADSDDDTDSETE